MSWDFYGSDLDLTQATGCTTLWQEVKTKEPLDRPTTWQWVYRRSWFESVPSIIQCTKYTISNHPLFQRSVLDVKLRERQGALKSV